MYLLQNDRILCYLEVSVLKRVFFFCFREKLKKFLWSVRDVNGAFSMHVGGEVDIRGLYCALSVARLTNIYSDDLFDKSAQWIVRYINKLYNFN